jgi:hypothetical protein
VLCRTAADCTATQRIAWWWSRASRDAQWFLSIVVSCEIPFPPCSVYVIFKIPIVPRGKISDNLLRPRSDGRCTSIVAKSARIRRRNLVTYPKSRHKDLDLPERRRLLRFCGKRLFSSDWRRRGLRRPWSYDKNDGCVDSLV